MKDYERSFVETMNYKIQSGLSFPLLMQGALRSKLGDVPGDILYRSLSKGARVDPTYFVREVSKSFGRGAMAIYDAVVSQAEAPAQPRVADAYESTIKQLISAIPDSPPVVRRVVVASKFNPSDGRADKESA